MSIELSDDLQLAKQAIESGNESIPAHYQFSPACMYHSEPKDAWDYWENDKYKAEWPECAKEWSQSLSKVRRLIKLQRMRQLNPSYYNKSERNYTRCKENRRLRRLYY